MNGKGMQFWEKRGERKRGFKKKKTQRKRGKCPHVEYGLNQEFNSLLNLDKEGILFLLGYYCLKLSSSIRSLVYYLIWNSFWNKSDSPCLWKKKSSSSWFWIFQPTQVSYISIVLLRKIREKEMRVCVKKTLSLF